MITEYVNLVNENDEVIGQREKMEAHILGLLHRGFSIFIFRKRKELELLLQQRQTTKYHSANLWSNTCCGHPRPGEEMIPGAHRRLYEEMGIKIKTLHKADSFIYKVKLDNGLTEHEFDHVLVGFINRPKFTINPIEIQQFKWQSIQHVLADLQHNPNLYTAWFKQSFQIAVNYINKN